MIDNGYLVLTKITQDDRDFYNKIYSDSKLLKFIIAPLSIKASNKSFENTIKNMVCKPPKSILYCIRSKQNKEKLGIITLRWNQPTRKDVEIGIIILAKHQRQGVAYLAKSLIIQNTFEKLGVKKIVAICDKNNIAANKTNKKLGFAQLKQLLKVGNDKIIWGIKK